ncbi:hypothetical protein RBH26_14500 [Natronolimnohabitans sp. A-GB9]|uniref:hypothetical protein n=1 Tax=Natronolimnohabitans sp. A-GB9 TaxID=3069757 RepID=UPI0027AE752F|nr:hypothetical protein [Natronolimnohabitans sp. A-GB9]MDQ2051687.1 hypothetical protein [Natronolimnohabitans sp. A-GB9]
MGMQDISDDTERAAAAILRVLDPIEIIESLPPTVFPVSAKIQLDRTSREDHAYRDYRPPDYPVEVRVPAEAPYIPETTVHFDNPAERPPKNAHPVSTAEFVDGLEEIANHLEEDTATDPQRLYLTGICIAEVPSQYLTFDDGAHAVKPALYEENAEMTIAYFQKDNSLSAHNVREDLDEALPGETRTPLELIRLDEVIAKPSRLGRGTTRRAGRARYFTEHEAEKAGSVDTTPAIWQVKRLRRPGDGSRPLEAVLDEYYRFLPGLAETDLIRELTFVGQTRTVERFYAEQVLSR